MTGEVAGSLSSRSLEAGSVLPFVPDLDLLRTRLAEPARVLRLADGRAVGLIEVGDPDGSPVVWFHGSPSCRLEALLGEAYFRAHRWRVIALDRPGIGASSFLRAPLVQHAEDVAAIMDALGHARFGVVGGSGGGPYVLASARVLGPRLTGAVCIAPGGVLDGHATVASWIDRAGAALASHAPAVLGAYFRLMQVFAATPAWLAKPIAAILGGEEGKTFAEPAVLALMPALLRESLAQGARGAVEDYRRMGVPWGFAVEDIDFPVDFVHGRVDAFVPLAQTARFAKLTRHARLRVLDGKGHLGAIFALDQHAPF